MNKYGQYCPTARAAEVLGDRWTLLIVRDLLLGVQHFNELERGLPGISKALLAERLRRLHQLGVVERHGDSGCRKTSYQLTSAGWELFPVIDSLTRWGAKWAFGEPEPAELNPVLLLWWMRDRIHWDQLPKYRVVVEFQFREARPKCYWLVLNPGDASVCISHPGFDIDVLVSGELSVFYEVWLGRTTFWEAMSEQRLELDAAPALIRAFPKWFALSPVAWVVQAVANSNGSQKSS